MEKQFQNLMHTLNADKTKEIIELQKLARDLIIDGLRRDEHFEMIFCKDLFPDYQKGLEVNSHHFVCAITLELPFNDLVEISADPDNKGNVLINLSRVMEHLVKKKEFRKKQVLEQMLNENGYLLENKVQSWLQGRISSFITTKNIELEQSNEEKLKLKYIKQGPAHRIEITYEEVKFSIKFLPFFLFSANMAVTTKTVTSKHWEAIPKPMGGINNPSFRTSYIMSENGIFKNKNNFKHVLQLMLKFRNLRPKMTNLKSYHLKSIFLAVDEELGSSIWDKQGFDILRELFKRLQIALEKKEIKFFWDPELNLLSDLTISKIESMNEEVKAALSILTQPCQNVYNIFLTLDEQMEHLDLSVDKVEVDKIFQVISSIINIDKNRERYTKMYDFVKTSFIRGLKEDENFKSLFADLKLAGSYADNLKISKPDEFDVLISLKLAYNELVEISPDNANRGNVFINVSRVLDRLLSDNKIKSFQFLKKMVNKENFLLKDMIHSWVEGLFSVYIDSINHELIYEDGSILHIKYSKQGPAHTITVVCGDCKFSIDFVPAFQFDEKKSISKRPLTRSSATWDAVPKPMGIKSNLSFRTSFSDFERIRIQKKDQLKNVLRLMKKYRDTNAKLKHLKSYFIKTLFLWHNEKCDAGFWRKPPLDILKEMFDVVENALKRREIKFFWDEELNMLDKFSFEQIDSMYYEVKAANKCLRSAESPTDILRIFLTEEELQENADLIATVQ